MPTNTFLDPLLHKGAAPDGDDRLDRLARLSERSAAHRRQLGAPVPGRPGLPPPPPGYRPPVPPTRRTAARRHAAKGSRAMALALSVGTTVALAGWFKVQQDAGSPVVTAGAAAGTDTVTEAATATTAATVTEAAAATTAGTAAATTAGAALADGTFTGATATNKWGPVQVAITVSDGTITEVSVLQYPDGDRKSVSINQRALPALEEEALAAQSADIDTVSGATYTSDSYAVSLQSAIDAARAAVAAG